VIESYMPTTTDVLIVGAGPTGLTLAIQLARSGISCRIIDTASAPTDTSKALAVQARTLEIFAAMGIADAAIDRGIRAGGFNFYARGRSLGHARFTADPDTPYPYILLLAQSETERILIDRLTSLGVQVERGVTMTAFRQDGSGVTATLSRADGPEETVRAHWLVGCDGAHSAVRHGLHMPFAGSDYEDLYWLADVHVRWPLTADEVHGFLGRRGLLFAFPIAAPDRYRLIARRDGATREAAENPTLADMQSLMDAIGPANTMLSDPLWLTAFRLHHRKVTRFRVDRVFLAGDAAHIHSPAGGQGMNTGIQDAYNLAWKLALVIRGEADAALLDSYDTERGAVAAQVLRQTDLMFRAMTVQSAPLRAIRNRLLPFLISRRALIRRMQRTIGELDIRYRRSLIVAEDGRKGSPPVGTRAPDAPLALVPPGGATTLWQVCQGNEPLRATLLLFSGRVPSHGDFERLAAIGQMVRERYDHDIAVYLIAIGENAAAESPWGGPRYDDPASAAHRRYGITAPALLAIRPDGYIGFRSQPANGDALRDYLDHIFTPREAAHEQETGTVPGAHPATG
jgi:2-polyprenyl-6-methoxyphenol hydroxylase-like FAD-dependent oxidoreductase